MLQAFRRTIPTASPPAAMDSRLELPLRQSVDLLGALSSSMASLAAQQSPLIQAQLESVRLAILASDPKYADPRRLNRFEFKVFSQFGEDGILQEIFRRIGVTNRSFVEFGVEGGLECNTAYLLLQGWSGLWIEPVSDYVSAIEKGLASVLRDGRLKVLHEAVTAINVEPLFARGQVPEEPDLLSIDIDSNDYWVWQAITHYRPRVVAIEYNATFPPPSRWVMPHDANYRWNGTAKFGASLEALARLGKDKGYSLVGCGLAGVNAFFVRDDLVGEHFAAPLSAAHHYEVPRYYLFYQQVGHPRSYELFS